MDCLYDLSFGQNTNVKFISHFRFEKHNKSEITYPSMKVTDWATPSFSQPLNPCHSLAICAWPCIRWNSSDFKAVRKQRRTGTPTRPTQHSTILMDDDFLSETLGLRCTF